MKIKLDPNPASAPDAGGGDAAQTGQDVFNEPQAQGAPETNANPAATTAAIAAVAGQGADGTQAPAQVSPPATGATGTGLSKEDITKIIAEAGKTIGNQQPTQATQVARSYTQAEFDQAFNVVQVAEQHLTELGLPVNPQSLATMNALLQGAARQAMTMADYKIQQVVQQFNAQLAPVTEHVTTQREETLKREFLEEHKDLAGYEPLLLVVKDQLVKEKFTAPDKKTLFNEVAQRTRNLLKTIPGLQAAANGQQGQAAPTGAASAPATASPSRMTTLSSGGQGGAGRSNPNGAPSRGGSSAGHAVFS